MLLRTVLIVWEVITAKISSKKMMLFFYRGVFLNMVLFFTEGFKKMVLFFYRGVF